MDVRVQPGKHQIRKTKKPYKSAICKAFTHLAEWTGLEPATPGVTGRYSNQLNYHSSRCGIATPQRGRTIPVCRQAVNHFAEIPWLIFTPARLVTVPTIYETYTRPEKS